MRFDFGRKIRLKPFCFAKFVMGRMPLIGLTAPLRESSPMIIASANGWDGIWFEAANSAAAMGRSKVDPVFLSSAGAKLMIFFWIGYVSWEFLIAERTRSLDSWTEVSPSPTTLNEESPREMSASTSISSGVRPVSEIE